MNQLLAIFRLDATPALGAGHLVRCRVLAAMLEGEGWRARFAVSAETAKTIGAPGDSIIMPPEARDEPSALRAAEPAGCDLLVVDHYGRDAAFEQVCRPWARRVFVLDDLADRPHEPDWLLDPTPGRTPAEYAGRVPRDTRLLLGSSYALLDPRFARARPAALVRRRAGGPAARVLISPGGTDPADVAGLALDALAGIQPALMADVALLPGAPHLARLRKRAGPDILFHVPARDMAALMVEADFALGAPGGSAWERCCLGLPTLLVVTANNQRLNVKRLEEAGAATVVGEAGQVSVETLRAALVALIDDAARRHRMAEAAASLCDGEGARRVLAVIMEEA
jgi:UDP-2,4-diacetamido-2,4,6-trideoxy-beta-L-altropyranose hydrolase